MIKVFFYCCLLYEVKNLCSPLLWCNLCNSVFFHFPCVQDFHALVRYLNQFPPGEFLPAMSNCHLLVFLTTSDMLPLEVMFMCWLRACDEITANKLQSDTLQPKSGFGAKLMNSKERLLIVLKKTQGWVVSVKSAIGYQIWKLLKKIWLNFFFSWIWLFDAVQRTQKIIPKGFWTKE